MVSFNGAVGYSELRSMPIPELLRLHSEAARIQKEIERHSGGGF